MTTNLMRFSKWNPFSSHIKSIFYRQYQNNSRRMFNGQIRYFKTNRNKAQSHLELFNERYINNPNLWKPFVFTVAFSFGTFTVVSIWEYERKFHWMRRNEHFWYSQEPQKKRPKNELWEQIKEAWNSITQKDKLFLPICAINIAVFGLWRFKKLHPFMIQYFSSNPFARTVCTPMLFSMFSHYSLWHLGANMFVLNSFSRPAVGTLGPEQFMLIYLCSGLFSNFSSFVYKVLTSQPGRSLGASGAIMGILAYICTKYPDQYLSIIFLPTITFTAGLAIKCLVAVDLLGCVLRWRFFDHAAHLGGAFVGICWFYVGDSIWTKRKYIKNYWHKIRSSE